ncbi:purine-nucleoside phosphorylase [Paenibacillaceae bacterium T2]|uniref:Purine nucleoside phosphorylase n=2 Tax=Ferviditalea candida TaxID=3108399 RepID=A0ABU5ZN88_9BACL|nr:purine-nucleoside phosphorylase [Paenibacillaceae bacterium T2]
MNPTSSYPEQIEEAARFMKDRISKYAYSGSGDERFEPAVGLILGSGLGDLADQVEYPLFIHYGDIPHFPVSTVEGHAGRFAIGRLEGKNVIAMQGRLHYYEGYPMKKVVFPVYVLRQLGIRSLIVTNAAGGMNRSFKPGDLMLIKDHINFTGDNPLIGPNFDQLGVRFPDLSEAYDRSFRELARRVGEEIEDADGHPLKLQEGVYCGISGPSYMTPSELKMLALLGGDAVGMSTVAEVIAARHAGLRVLGVSCITDMAVGDELEPLTHEQVMEVAERTKPKFTSLIRAFLRNVEKADAGLS